MNNSYQQEERELLLIDYIYRVLSHWRSIIVAMVVCAVALGGLKYFKDTKDLKAQMQAQENFDPEERLDAMLSQLTDKEKRAVESVLRFEKFKTEKEEYIDTAAIMKLDQSEVDECILQYHVETEGNATELLNAYKSNFLNDDVMKEIAEQSEQMETKDVKVMVTATCDEKEVVPVGEDSTIILGNEDSLYESLYITVRGFSKDEVTNMSEVIKKSVSDYSKKAKGVYGKHKITLANASYQKCTDEYVVNIQDDAYDQALDMQSKINTMMNSFSEDQNNIVDFYINNIDQENETAISDDSIPSVSVNKAWILIGAFLGICIIAGWHFLVWALGGQINSPEELNENYPIYNFGIYEDEEKANKRRFFDGIDRLIYHICYRSRVKLTTEESFSVILSGVVEKCKSQNIEKVFLTNMGNVNDRTRAFCEELIKATETEGISLLMGGYPCEKASGLSQMIQCGHVILCDNVVNKKHNDYILLLQMCKEYNVNMVGTVFIM